ncbi:hypothetical protein [Acinetobacter guillouiae]|uniref:hypothetical protein n=1 Tax=Acinetobacter guillouiae TaxID=106649 RepID=UPI0028D5BB08|nr:hypothetical protein [Acinetobacter guillouiae]
MQNDSNVEMQQTKTKYTVDPEFKEYYIDLVGEDEADFTVDKDGLLEDRDAFICYASWEYKNEQLKKFQNQVDSLKLQNDCMIGQTWFMKGTPVSALIEFAENIYKSEAIAQNSKIKFGTDDNEVWWAHEVPFFGEVQMNWIKEDQEWDIYLDGCWQGPFNSKSECIQHLEACIQEKSEELGQEV